MRVNLNVGQTRNTIQVERINQNLAKSNQTYIFNERTGRKDKAEVSSSGKSMSLMENLLKQKENINEQKNKLIGQTVEKNEDLSTIKEQLKIYEEQLKNVDKQIVDATTMENEALVKETENKNKDKDNDNLQNANKHGDGELKDITNLVVSLDQLKETVSFKERNENQIKILESEISLNEGRVDLVFERTNGRDLLSAHSNVVKVERVTELETKNHMLDQSIGEQMQEINDVMESDNNITKKLDSDNNEIKEEKVKNEAEEVE